jgi:hypothetical protein
MRHTQNLTNLVALPIGMIFLLIIVNLLLVFHLRKSREVEAPVVVEETARRHSEVGLQAPLHISMSKTNHHSHLLIIKLPLPVEVAFLLGEEEDREVGHRMQREVMFVEDVVALLDEVIKINVVAGGGAGGIGTRLVFSLAVSQFPF